MQKYYSVFNNILFYLFLALLVFIPAYPKLPLESVSGTYVAIRLDDIFIAVVLGLWFLLNLGRLKELLSKNITRSALLFWAIGLLSLFSALFITFSVSFHLGFLNWARRVETVGLLFVGWTTVTNRKQIRIILATMLVLTALICLYGLGQVYAHLPVISTSNAEYAKGQILYLTPGARPNSTFAGAYDLAIYLSMALVFLGTFFFFYRKLFQKAVIAIGGGLSAGLLAIDAARTSFAASFVGLAVVLLALKKRMLIVALIILAIATVAAVPSLRHRLVDTVTINILKEGARYVPPSPSPTPVQSPGERAAVVATESAVASTSGVPYGIVAGEPLNSSALDVYRSVNIRTAVEWPRAVHGFYKNPFLGTGYSSLTNATDNDYLRSLGEVGILGTLALAILLLAICKQLFAGLRSRDRLLRYFFLATLVMILAFLINAVFIDVFESSKVAEIFWMIIGVALAGKEMDSR